MSATLCNGRGMSISVNLASVALASPLLHLSNHHCQIWSPCNSSNTFYVIHVVCQKYTKIRFFVHYKKCLDYSSLFTQMFGDPCPLFCTLAYFITSCLLIILINIPWCFPWSKRWCLPNFSKVSSSSRMTIHYKTFMLFSLMEEENFSQSTSTFSKLTSFIISHVHTPPSIMA